MHSYSADLIRAYRDFKSLDTADALAIVRHYERNEKALCALDADQSFDCLATYTDALFNAELYRKHLVMSEYLLEVIIIENYTTFHGEDIYQHTLLRKACSHSNLGNKEKGKEVIEELIRINPDHKAARHVLATILLREQPVWYRKWTTFNLAAIVLAACCFAVSTFGYFMGNASYPYAFIAGSVLLGLAVLAIAGTRAYHTWHSFAYPRHLARKLLRKRKEV
jgi:tetratricopeptide (TPR) repeat protein